MGANMLLTIGALVIFGIFLGAANKLMIGNNQIASQNEYYITAISLAQSVIDEAKTKAFDEKTVSGSVSNRTSLTAVASIGKDGASEAVPFPDTLSSSSPYSSTNKGYWSAIKFDDVDDYNGYYRLVNTPRAEGYQIRVTVNYANENSPDNSSLTQTYCKRMVVKVTSPYFPKASDGAGSTVPDTLTLSYAFTY